MGRLTRRTFLQSSAAVAGAAAFSAVPAIGQAKPRVVVIGGGAGGTTAAKYIARDSKGAIDVTLVEPLKRYQTCFHSNLYLGGYRSYDSITHGYEKLTSAYGVKMNHQWASAIDRDKKQVVLADGSRLSYDRLVVSPGIALKYDSVPGWSKEHEVAMPHAWLPGEQTQILKKRLDAVPDGGVIVMIAPPNPFRCPPGPYERVSMMAHALKAAGKSKSKIIIIDPKENFSKQGLFQEGWEKYYKGMVEWLGPKVHDGLKSVDPKTNTVVTGFETYKAALVNVIPAQTAGAIAIDAKLTNAGGFCPIDAASMKSTVDPNIYVLGDASIAGDMPKSGFSANSQAKVAALMIRGELIKAETFPARYANTCWSLIETDDAVKVGGRYEAKDGKIAATETFVSKTGESADLRKATQAENMGWYAGISADMFG
jgi:sulfide dehydrogenase [flavocytochrome c] flavoprotein subunit